jgi:hypothetical protein
MNSDISTSLKVLFAVLALLLLSACGSNLTGINAPDAVEKDQEFEVSVTHQFLGDDGIFGPASSPDGALVFGVFIPSAWSANPLAHYQGTWNTEEQNLDMVLQIAIPVTNFVEFLEDLEEDDASDEIITAMSLSDCSTVLDDLGDEAAGFQFLFFQSTDDLYDGPSPLTGDTGEFFFELTASGNEGENEVVVIHGLLMGGPGSDEPDSPFENILGCSWYPDVDASEDEEIFVPDVEIAVFKLFNSESMPVPVMGGAMIAILALLMAFAGILVGRRKSKQLG